MSGSATPLPSSFRDNSGFVFARDGVILRQVSDAGAENYDALIDSGLRDVLVERGWMVGHEEVDVEVDVTGAPGPGTYKVIRPEPIPLITYPYEWCFGQLKDAALLTIGVQKVALEHGMSLRDASAYNIQWLSGRPVLIDTLSFEKLKEGEPWVAYRQFCQHFLAPLALMSYRDVRLGQLLRAFIDGVPLDLAAELLPKKARLHPPLLLHVFSHSKSQARAAKKDTSAEIEKRRGSFSMRAFQGLVDSLEGAVKKLMWEPRQEGWSTYYGDRESYSEGSLAHKEELFRDLVSASQAKVIWDLGANTGHFSRIAADAAGADLVASWEMEWSCVEASYRQAKEEGSAVILPLVLDLSNPSPALGWAHRERDSLVDRGPADLVLALALLHHLAIANNVPLPLLATFLRKLGKSVIIEFVPKEDPMVRQLLANREDIFEDYTQEGFERAFTKEFTIARAEPIKGSERVLYLLRATG